MTPLMLAGMLLSFLGVAVTIGLTIYYLSLPLQAPLRLFLDTTEMGIPYLVYFVILGAAISAFGMMIYIKAVRTGVTISAHPRYPAQPRTRVLRRPSPVRRPTPRPTAAPRSSNVVEEIEKEIEEIIRSQEPVAEKPEAEEEAVQPPAEAAEEKVRKRSLVEVVSRASDMVCPHCGSINPLGSTKCSSCGKPLFKPEEPSKSCPVCGAPLRLAQRISNGLFVCGICFSELRIDPILQKSLKLR